MNDAVQIGDGWPPALPDGSYTLTVTQTVVPGTAPQQQFTADYGLTVSGPRFTIAPSDLHSRYPAPGSTGTYAALLPQVVLTRATLPWERAIDGSALVPGALPTPFVGLLVVSGADAPAVTPGVLNDLLNVPTGTVGPDVHLTPDESGTDPCAYADFPVGVFEAAAPAVTDLELLAHLRQADPSTKALGEAPADGWFAVVIANRFPALSQPSTAYLVSLEGQSARLSPGAAVAGTLAIRLAVLTSWSFNDDGGSEQAFTQSLLALGSAALAVPPLAGASDPAAAVLAQGYVPMRHVTRQAETIASFYRGPLVPSPPAGAQASVSHACSDAALRFDPATGLLDVSYAAAWQLGRLLALNDREVAQAIYQWRRSHVERATRLAGRVMLARRFPSLGLAGEAHALLRGHAVRRAMARMLTDELAPTLAGRTLAVVPAPPPGAGRSGTLQPAAEQAALLRAFRADPRHWLGLTADDDQPVPDVVTAWLGRLHQLYGLPFNLLVPDARALPTETIRFFFVDPAWLAALTDGALSVGRTTTFDAEHDAALAPLVAARAVQARNAVRAQALGLPAPPAAGGPLSGFLLRSAAIAGWRGVEIAVFAANGQQPLTLVRLDRVSDNVLLCLVDGPLASVRFTQPTEGLQFGVETTGGLDVELRDLRTGTTGTSLKTNGTLVQRAGLLDAAASASALSTALTNTGTWPNGQPLTSGDLAVQLLEGGQIVDLPITITTPATVAGAMPTADALLAGGRGALQRFIERELSDDQR